MMEINGTKDGKPVHEYIEFMYPEIYEKEKSTIEVGLCHVLAADSIRISYDADRDGWIIEQAAIFGWDTEYRGQDCDWQEVAFIQAGAREK